MITLNEAVFDRYQSGHITKRQHDAVMAVWQDFTKQALQASGWMGIDDLDAALTRLARLNTATRALQVQIRALRAGLPREVAP